MRKLYLLVAILACAASCREQYDPNAKSLDKSYLVVEANLDPGPDSTIIRLTRTSALNNRSTIITENGATVTIEGEDNSSRTLIPIANGYYVSPNLNLTIGTGYRIHIRLADGKEYRSDIVKARVTPAIDSINAVQTDAVYIYANTHDPSGNSRYYRWDFDETWEIRSYYYAEYIWDNAIRDVRYRILPGEDVYKCWKYDFSNSILLANTTRLQDDIVYRSHLTTIPYSDERVSVRYSTLVRQYALDKGAYDFFELMKKNTEQVGSIFAPQPFELNGNIKCITDKSEYALGYLTASTVQKQRIFLTVQRPGFSQDCPSIKVTRDSVLYYFGGGDYIPWTFDFTENKYLGAKPQCADCRRRGGDLNRPSYW